MLLVHHITDLELIHNLANSESQMILSWVREGCSWFFNIHFINNQIDYKKYSLWL